MASLIWSAAAVSSMSLDVAPTWTYFPLSPHCSLRALIRAVISWLILASISWTRASLTYLVEAVFFTMSAWSCLMLPTFACAMARAASTSSSLWSLFSSSNMAFISGRPYLKSNGQTGMRSPPLGSR